MSGRFVLDASVVIALMRGDNSIVQRLSQADEVLIPSIVLGELYYGAHNSSRVDANLLQTRSLASNYAVLSCDERVAEEYGVIRRELRVKGALIPENDIWIAATARLHGLTLATRDAHSTSVDGLSMEAW